MPLIETLTIVVLSLGIVAFIFLFVCLLKAACLLKAKRHRWEIIEEHKSDKAITHTLKCLECGAVKKVRNRR